jgi:protein SCO1/2
MYHANSRSIQSTPQCSQSGVLPPQSRAGCAAFKRIVSSCAVLALFLMLAGCVSTPSLISSCCTTNPAATPFTDKSLYQIESTWTNDFGHPLQLGALRGRVQVVAMFFASCTYACPLIVHDLQRIETALPESLRTNVNFTLITIDTERDTPSALHAYRGTRKLPADRWTLLRGAPDDTLELAALLGVKFKREARGQFAHSNLITVLNEQGEIIHQLTGLSQEVGETVKRISTEATK